MKPRPEDIAASRTTAVSKASPSRRRFLKAIAAGAVAAVAGQSVIAAAASQHPLRGIAPHPLRGTRRAASRRKAATRTMEAQRSASVEAEIKNQKGYTARTLKVIRDYPLPPGSEMAFAFRPMKAARALRDGGRSGR